MARAAMGSLHKCEVDYTVRVIDAYAEKLSFSQAIHQGVAEGSSPIICALNADVECRGSQQSILDLFDDPEVAVVGPLQVDQRGLVKHGGIVGSNEKPEHRGWNVPIDMQPELREITDDVVSVSGSVYYCRRSVWEELGGFLDTRLYYEETWLSYLARHRGYRVVFMGGVEWLHLWNSSPVDDMQKREWFLESQALFRRACAREGIACD